MTYSTAIKTTVMIPLLLGALSSSAASHHRISPQKGHRVQGAYVDLLAGYGQYDISGGRFKDSDNSGLAGVLNIGYQFSPNFALEVGLGYSARLSGKFILPMNCDTDAYAKLGLGYGFVTVKETTTFTNAYGSRTTRTENTDAYMVANLGAGVNHWFNDRWAMSGEVNYITNSIGSGDFDMRAVEAVVGATYHF